jgi:hypothetical protein
MKLILHKTPLLIATLMLLISTNAHAYADATAHGIERGAEATRNAAHAVAEKVGGDERVQGLISL